MNKGLLILISFLFVNSTIAQDYLSEFQEKWQNAKDYTIELLDTFPENQLDFKPTDDVRSTREQFEHLLNNMIWLSTTHLTDNKFKLKTEMNELNKQQIKYLLISGFDFVLQAIEKFDSEKLNDKVDFFSGEKTKRQIFTLINDHLTHHRAQLIVYLRLNNIKPPRYRGW